METLADYYYSIEARALRTYSRTNLPPLSPLRIATMAVSSLSAEAQKELLLRLAGMGLPFETWRANMPLGNFEGVEVGEDGFVAVLNFSQKKGIRFELRSFQRLVSLKEINFSGCRNATGGILVKSLVFLHRSSLNTPMSPTRQFFGRKNSASFCMIFTSPQPFVPSNTLL